MDELSGWISAHVKGKQKAKIAYAPVPHSLQLWNGFGSAYLLPCLSFREKSRPIRGAQQISQKTIAKQKWSRPYSLNSTHAQAEGKNIHRWIEHILLNIVETDQNAYTYACI